VNVDTQPAPVRVLLIDDDRDDFLLTRELLADVPGGRFELDWAQDYDAGRAAVRECRHDVYLIDECRACPRSGPAILLTGQGQLRTDRDALAAGADDYLEKAGLTPALLDRAIRFAVAQYRAAADLEREVRARTAALDRANAALREADRRKDEFLATLGHELRNPLSPILNALELLRIANDTGDTVRRQRARIERQVAQLVRLVDDLLDVSRITTGKLRLNPEPLTAQEVLEVAFEASRPRLEAAGLELVTDLPAGPVPLTGDRVRLAQVFTNVLNNAAKFTLPGGRVTVTVAPA
jgi:signal transduction histidine kinase